MHLSLHEGGLYAFSRMAITAAVPGFAFVFAQDINNLIETY